MTGVVVASSGCRGGGGGGGGGKKARGESQQQQQQLSMVALLMATIRKSMVYCRVSFREEDVVSAAAEGIDIGWPTEVQHVAHVTFDRFKGFLGLPVEFELEVSCSAPSASASVFGVSAELMQCGFDSKGNSVPIILLLMQERLYSQGGLKAEGIFRINPENSEEKDLRNQLNKGIVPDDIDVHCLAGLIKAWFRELPEGVLDSLSPGQVLQCENEEDCVELVKLLPPMQFALVKWVVNLMADVVEEEELNKMNARNIAMVFAPNMTQLSDPLTSLMHAVQVMNLLQTLIFRTLRERDEEAGAADKDWSFSCSPSLDYDDHETDELRESSSEDDCGVVGVTGDVLRVGTANDLQGFHYESSIDEDEIVEEIQECFLRHLVLDWDRESKDAARELVRPRTGCCGYQETKFSCTDQLSTTDSSIMTSEINHSNSSITVDDVVSATKPPEPVEHDRELEMIADATEFSFSHLSTSESSVMMSESNHCNSSRTVSDVDSVTIVPDVVRVARKPPEPVEHDRELEMIADATEFSFTHLSTSESSVMMSESNHCNSSRTVSDVDSVTVVPEDVRVDARPPEPPAEDDKELEMVADATKLCCNDSSISSRSNSSVTIDDDMVPEDVAMGTKGSDSCDK